MHPSLCALSCARLISIFGLMCLTWTGLAVADGDPPPTLRNELQQYLIPVFRNLDTYYIDKVPPDSLMRAGVSGLFSALDPASDYTFGEPSDDWKANFDTFHRISSTVVDSALYTVGPDTLVRLGIAGMLSVLDPDTNFLEKRRLDDFLIGTKGVYGGLGFRIQVVRPDSAIAVWSLLHEDTPAARAGVRAGDLIVAIDDSVTTHMSAGDAASLMRGLENTPVTLTIERAGVEDPLEITVVRERVQVKSVPYFGMLTDSAGYVKLSAFQDKCSADVRHAIGELKKRGLESLVFDMTDNRGGFLHEAVSIADFFLPPDRLVVFTAGRAFSDTTVHRTRHEQLFDGPLICLVNGPSASASEIVAGAIQDWDRGLILGQPTTGKGSVQRTVQIGDKAELKLTVAAYFIPSGRSIDKRMRKDSTLVALSDKEFHTLTLGRTVHGAGGIIPDIVLDGRRRTALYSQLSGWRTFDSKFFRFARQYHLQHPDVTPSFVVDKRTLKEFREFVDAQEFEYRSALEARLEHLEKMLSEEEEDDRVKRPMERLAEEIEEIEEKHWKAEAELISWQLTFDILDKQFGIEAAHAYDATVDPQIQRAVEILAEPLEYDSWFRRQEVGLSDKEIAARGIDSSAFKP